MALTTASIEQTAPDQASLKAAAKLLSPAKWPERLISADDGLIWGACQGSGANPYRVVVDLSDLGAKCSCPSRKFPCKHALALMLLYGEGADDFLPGTVPDWVTEWLGRRRKTDTVPKDEIIGTGKSLADALKDDIPVPVDAKTQAQREAAKQKRAAATRQAITDGMADLERWIADQLRTGLSDLLGDLTPRCRRIAARLVDAKAGTLAARIDGIPARVLGLPQGDRADAVIAELGKLVILSRAWGDGVAADPSVRREITGAEPRDALLANTETVRQTGLWEVLATREETRRDNLIARSTWLLALDGGHRFALLQDFFPASTGRQGAAFSLGEQFHAEMAFYPSAHPLRAQIVERRPREGLRHWPEISPATDVLKSFAAALAHEPWLLELPILLPQGRVAEAGSTPWWSGDHDTALPLLSETVDLSLCGAEIQSAAVLWNGHRASLLAAQTNLGRFHADG
ncbi:SWIM zinc finger domain-containing protein [Actibacterium sp. 188UL27-1]|uniref:SWIM zinc finger family protein n=1 Tax=Actibacterium sp. 188UL27-1 TaxID=2786961 RepID=UPI0019572B80|nr:SWIM zinc finger family protein [Actibacterium sp. 188UL27-1]MBM7065982.1 SWIM zinc finger family protein [Actibacterium sp. 188UL27-1]